MAAESILISVCENVLSEIASEPFKKIYEKGVSIWEARDELDKLKVTIKKFQAVLLDAEKKQEGSAAVKDWIRSLKGVLYDAEDFFDEIVTEDLLKGLIMEEESSCTCGCLPGTDLLFKGMLSLENQVPVFCSKLNPIVSRNSIADRVKTISGRLAEISNDITQLGFVEGRLTNRRRERISAIYLPEKSIIGRDEDKNAILEMVISGSSGSAIKDGLVVIAIDGIGGMGKTTIAHLIFNHEEVKKIFENNRWFACISKTTNEKEVVGKIYQSICGGGYSDLNMFQLQEKIREKIEGKKYLLVLDDVWEDHRGKWENRKSMLSSGAKGSKIIVTTRLQTVVKAMGAIEAHNLKGLSEEGSWDLFKSLAFDSPYENGPRRENVGKKLLERCKGVPLAIWSLGSLLSNKTVQEWEKIERVGLPIVGGEYNDEVMSVLKLSYDHLQPELKQCFTYCCLYPKDHVYMKIDMICHWISQGYINTDDGESSFMDLLRMGFFQEQKVDKFGEIRGCKMHDIMHDLAMHVGGEEIIVMSGTSLNASSCTRHVRLMVDGEEGGLPDIPTSIRSCMLSGSSPNLGQLFSKFKLLRTLCLIDLGIEHIPPSIGELKLVRYLDLSDNNFEELPDSIANLVNLLVLDVNRCKKLKAWPNNFKKLMKLWSLYFEDCDELRLMPEGIGEIASLQHLSHFMVGKKSEIDGLNRLLEQLRSHLIIAFCKEMEVEQLRSPLKLPANLSLQSLAISLYPGLRIQGWGNTNNTSELEVLEMSYCRNIKYLPTLSCLPNLKHLVVRKLLDLEFMEDEEEENAYSNATRNTLFFPCLKKLILDDLPKLKAWRGEIAVLEFSRLSEVDIKNCPSLESFPQCPNLQQFSVKGGISSTNLFSYNYPSLQRLYISGCSVLEKLHLESPHIQRIEIKWCNDLMSIELEGTTEPSLRYFNIENCKQLKTLQIEEQLFAGVQHMSIEGCPELRLRLSETQGKRLLVQRGLPEVENCYLCLIDVDTVLLEQLLSILLPENIEIRGCSGLPICLPSVSLAYLRTCQIGCTSGIERLHIPSPHLRDLWLHACEGLISIEVEATASISIKRCKELKNLRIANPNALEEIIYDSSSDMVAGVDWDSIPNLGECSCITRLHLSGVDGMFIERLLSSKTSPQDMSSVFKSIGALTIPFTSLERFYVGVIPGLKILNIQSPHLTNLSILSVCQLTHVGVVNPIPLKKLRFFGCPELRLRTCVEWDALSNLTRLTLRPMPPREELPECLLQREALGHLKISNW